MLVAGELWHDNSFWNWMWESWKVPFSYLSVLIKFIGYRTWSHMSLNPSHLRPSMYLINGLQSQKTITLCLDLSLFFHIYSPIFISTIFIKKMLCNIPGILLLSVIEARAKWRRGKMSGGISLPVWFAGLFRKPLTTCVALTVFHRHSVTPHREVSTCPFIWGNTSSLMVAGT